MAFLKFNNFKGVNTEDEVLSPNVLTFGLNTDTSDGRLKKRSGIASLVDITDIPKGLHKARFQSGETLVVGADTEAYKLSGTEFSELVTKSSDFEDGTFNNVTLGSKKVIDNMTAGTTVSSVTTYLGQTFKSTEFDNVEKISVYVNPAIAGSAFVLKLYDSELKTTLLGTSNTVSTSTAQEYTFVFATPIATQIYTNLYFELTATAGAFSTNIHTNELYADGDAYYSGSVKTPKDLRFSIFTNSGVKLSVGENSGEYISKVFDLTQTPILNSLYFNNTTPLDTSINVFARGSDDGVRFGDWGIVSTSGSSINLNRFIQLRFILTITSGSTSPSVDDFTITYTKTFYTATQFDTGLTGNKIRWVNYQGQAFTTTGSISNGSPTLTVASATGFANGQTVFVEGAGSAGGYLEATVSNVVGTTITLSTNASTTVSNAYVRIELYSSKYYVYYADGTNVKKYDGTTVTAIGSVPASNIIYEHKGYMFYVPSVDPTRLYFSDVYGTNLADPLGDFESVQPQSYKQFSSPIKGLRTFEGKLVVSGNDFTSFVTGSIFGGANDDTVIYQIDDIGVTNHESMAIASTNNGTLLALVTDSGVRYLTGGVYENALQQAPLSETVSFYLKDGNFDNSWAFTFKNKLYVGFDSGVLPALYNDSVLVWDFRRGVIDGIWSLHLNDCAEFNNVLYGSSSEDGNLYELLTGSDDNGVDINMIAKMRMHIGEVKATAQKFNIKATTDSDFDNSTKTLLYVTMDKTKELDLKEGRWRVSETALPQWKGQDLMEQKRNIKKRGTFIEITVDIASDKQIEFDSFELEYEGVRK